MAGAQFVRYSDRVSVMVVRDSSDSIDDSQLSAVDAELSKAVDTMKKDDSLGKVNFGADAYIELLPKQGVDKRLLTDWQTKPRGNFTNISEAMQLAVASFPDNAQKRLLLVTDGNENVGSALAEARVTRQRRGDHPRRAAHPGRAGGGARKPRGAIAGQPRREGRRTVRAEQYG